jgi:orotate phosphoribosyltransferase
MNSGTEHKEKLKELLRRKSIVRGKVKLSSGEESDYYIDCRLSTLDPEGAFLTAYTILELLEREGIEADAISGPSLGAHPIVAAVATVSYYRAKFEGKGKLLPAFLIRKEAKAHGLQKQIEGIDLKTIRNVVIVDDVCTTGESTLQALAAVEEAGLHVAAVISLVDREAGGSEKLRQKYRYFRIFTAKQLLQDDAEPSAEAPRSAKKALP